MNFVKQQPVRRLATVGLGLWLLTSGCAFQKGGRLGNLVERPPAMQGVEAPPEPAMAETQPVAATAEAAAAVAPVAMTAAAVPAPPSTPTLATTETPLVLGDETKSFASTVVLAQAEVPKLVPGPELKLSPAALGTVPKAEEKVAGLPPKPEVDPADAIPITLHMDDLDVRKALEMLSRESTLNVLVSPGVTGKVTADLKNVTYEQALQAILKLCDLSARREGSIIYVYTNEEISKQNNIGNDGKQVTRVYRLNYVRSADIATMIQPFLSQDGKLSQTPPSSVGISEGGAAGGGGTSGGSSGGSGGSSGGSGGGSGGSSGGGSGGSGGSGGGMAGALAGALGGGGGGGQSSGSGGGGGGSDGGTGGDAMAGGDFVVIQDTEAVLQTIDRLISQLDVQPIQVLIEAVIMTVTRTSSQDLGINYAVLDGAGRNLVAVGSGAAINAAAGFDPSQVLAAGSPLKTLGTTLVSQGGKLAGDSASGFAQNSQGIKFGFVDNNLTGFIRALEQIGETDILASPRLLVLNKQRAELQLGDRLGFRTLTQTQTSTVQKVEFLNVGTQLFLRPFISSDGMVRMEIHPERSEGSIVDNIPQTRTSQLTTNVMVPDGSTIVIGGLMETVANKTTSGIPGLGRLPWIGTLFRDRSMSTSKKELIVLLTPRIWKQNSEMLPVCPPPSSLLIPTTDQPYQQYQQYPSPTPATAPTSTPYPDPNVK
ncbi:MAG: xpsD [Planctomycetaceae bacterium]|nr:xpsD [Planctomycetaceae bacterium]